MANGNNSGIIFGIAALGAVAAAFFLFKGKTGNGNGQPPSGANIKAASGPIIE